MSTNLSYIAVPGTNAWSSNWCVDGPWTANMLTKGMVQFKRRHGNGSLRAYKWSTDLSGTGFLTWLGKDPGYREWIASGYGLIDHVDGFLDPIDTNIFCHSFGLQPVLVAAALGVKINFLCSIMSPVRLDMTMELDGKIVNVLELARPNINYWCHLHSDHTDNWARRGLFGNKKWFDEINPNVDRSHPWAIKGRGLNWFIPGVGHSRLLNEPEMPEFNQVWDVVHDMLVRETIDPKNPFRVAA